MSNTSGSMPLSTSSSGSGRSREGVGRQSDEGSDGLVIGTGRILMETIIEVREDPLEEITKSS